MFDFDLLEKNTMFKTLISEVLATGQSMIIIIMMIILSIMFNMSHNTIKIII